MACAAAMSDAGFESIILSHKDFSPSASSSSIAIHPWFSKTWAEGPRQDLLPFVLTPPFLTQALRSLILRPAQQDSFLTNVLKSISAHRLSAADHIFVHTLGVWQIIELLVALQLVSTKDAPHLHLVLRLDPFESGKTGAKVQLFRLMFKQFQRLVRSGARVSFYADTQELVDAYDSISPIRFKLLPILFDSKDLVIRSRPADQPFTVAYLGDSRAEKGFHHLPVIVKSVLEQTNSNEVRFEIQVQLQPHFPQHETLDRARNALKAMSHQQLRLHEGALSPEDYNRLLLGCDLVLIPYDRAPYERRSSGILSQAIAAGKLAIAPKGTWMGRTVSDYHCGLTYQNVSEIPGLILEAKKAVTSDSQLQSEKTRTKWLTVHSAQNFAKLIQE